MPSHFFDRVRQLPVVARVLIASVLVWGAVIGAAFGTERTWLFLNRNGIGKSPPGKDNPWRPFPQPGIERPAVVSAEGARLPDEEVVIGVVVGGKARAYRLDAFRDRRRHIVNDLIGRVPVSVTYCDLTDCVQVYTDPRGSTPLDVALAGLYEGQMVVKINGVLFIHKTGARLHPEAGSAGLPYDSLPPTRTSWKEWKERHPETDVSGGQIEPAGRQTP